MCGILLSVSINNSLNRYNFNRALNTLSHRGLDSTNVQFFDNDLCALGHKRLTIQDLSKNGNQPMNSENLWVIFNVKFTTIRRLKVSSLRKVISLEPSVIPKFCYMDIKSGARSFVIT